MIKVKALKLGFYGDRRCYPGSVFEVEKPEHVSKNWMEVISDEPKEERKKLNSRVKKD